jgi:O-antigen/teichoic acid export membrane protein
MRPPSGDESVPSPVDRVPNSLRNPVPASLREPPPTSARGEGVVAARNAIKLSASLLATWTVALVIRFQLPRHLGPARFGEYSFAEGFAAALCVFLAFGLDLYIQKELPTRPRHASDFFGVTTVLRALLLLPLFVIMAIAVRLGGHSLEIVWLTLIFGLAFYFERVNLSLAAVMQAATRVDSLAIQNVVSKFIWGVGVAIGIWLGWSLLLLAIPFLLAEVLKTLVLFRVASRDLGLRFRVDWKYLRPVLKASLPYYVNGIAVTLASRLDISMLGFLTTDSEVGWYGAAHNLASLAMLLSPLLGWVFMPLFARAYHRSEEEFLRLLRRAIEGILVIAVPVTLLIGLGADLWIVVAFGESFANSSLSLMMLAPIFIATYLAMLLSTALIITNRAWQLTTISLIGICIQPALILLLVPLLSQLGPGGAGAGAAAGLMGMELFVSGAMLLIIGKSCLDARNIYAIAVSLAIGVLVVVVDQVALEAFGLWRLLIDMALYATLALGLRVLKIGDAIAAYHLVRARHQGESGDKPAG